MARFQVRKRLGRWEVSVLAPGARCWVVISEENTYRIAMLLATGQVPYGEWPGWGRTLTLKWSSI